MVDAIKPDSRGGVGVPALRKLPLSDRELWEMNRVKGKTVREILAHLQAMGYDTSKSAIHDAIKRYERTQSVGIPELPNFRPEHQRGDLHRAVVAFFKRKANQSISSAEQKILNEIEVAARSSGFTIYYNPTTGSGFRARKRKKSDGNELFVA